MSSVLQEIGGEQGGVYTSLCDKVYEGGKKVEERGCIIVKERKRKEKKFLKSRRVCVYIIGCLGRRSSKRENTVTVTVYVSLDV